MVQRGLLWLMRGLLTIGASLLFALTGAWGNETMDPYWLLPIGIFFIAALIVVPWAFNHLALADKTQAMGLPEGSIRAVIALSLVLLFGVLPIYFFNRVAGSGTTLQTIAGLTQDAKDQAAKDYSSYIPIFVKVVPDATKPDNFSYTMYYHPTADPTGVDFAKQMLVLLGTLATSVASFYFGSKTATSAAASATNATAAATAAAQGGGPQPKPVPAGLSTTPSPVTRSATGDVSFALDVLGTNLTTVSTIRIQSGATDKFSFSAKSNATEASCAVTCKPTVAAGAAWDVVLIDPSGESDPLTGHLSF